jgi:hypothetical protein
MDRSCNPRETFNVHFSIQVGLSLSLELQTQISTRIEKVWIATADPRLGTLSLTVRLIKMNYRKTPHFVHGTTLSLKNLFFEGSTRY